MEKWYVVDCAFNRYWNAKLIGQLLTDAPSYCVVVRVARACNPRQIEAGLQQAEQDVVHPANRQRTKPS